ATSRKGDAPGLTLRPRVIAGFNPPHRRDFTIQPVNPGLPGEARGALTARRQRHGRPCTAEEAGLGSARVEFFDRVEEAERPLGIRQTIDFPANPTRALLDRARKAPKVIERAAHS